jgi:hypothetical protein
VSKDEKSDRSDEKTPTARTKTATCPIDGAKAEIYEGDNPHKQGTAWCAKDGRIKIEK